MTHDENEIELTPEERMMLAALPREVPHGDLLEERVVRALRSEGYFGVSPRARNRAVGIALRVAAAVALFAGGVATGRFLMVPSEAQTASGSAPSTIRASDTSRPASSPSIPVKRRETVVAEREMWL